MTIILIKYIDHLVWFICAGTFCSVFGWPLQYLARDCPGVAITVSEMNGLYVVVKCWYVSAIGSFPDVTKWVYQATF